MSTLACGLASRFLVFCRRSLSENLIVSPSARNQTAESCGRPLAPTVPSTAICASSKLLCVSGISTPLMPSTLDCARASLRSSARYPQLFCGFSREAHCLKQGHKFLTLSGSHPVRRHIEAGQQQTDLFVPLAHLGVF